MAENNENQDNLTDEHIQNASQVTNDGETEPSKDERNENEQKENKVDLNELENSYNCLIDEELIDDPVEKEKLKERLRQRMELAKK